MKKIIISTSSEETQKLAINLSKKCKGGEVFALYGDLGSGKTTFTQGFAKGLGITGKVTSPTFIIMKRYQLDEKTLFHVDLYRTESVKDIEGLGLLELVGDKSTIVVIEWPERLKEMLPKESIRIHFSYVDEATRRIEIDNYE